MAIEKVKAYFAQWDMQHKIQEFQVSSATVELAAEALGCEPERIAKTLSFKFEDTGILIVMAGDAKVDNAKFKATFGMKAKMLTPEEVEALIGHTVGGVCPFGIPENIKVYLDQSLNRFDVVYPACGSSNSAIALTIKELETFSNSKEWVDVCKNWE